MTTDSLQSFISTWRNLAERSVDDLQTLHLEVDDMKQPITAEMTYGWRIVDGNGVVMAEQEPTVSRVSDILPPMVTEFEGLFMVEVPKRIFEVTSSWGDEAQNFLEDAGGDKEKAIAEMSKKHRVKREERLKRRQSQG